MPRLPRANLIGVPQHVIQRGNNHQACFACQQDYATYAGWLTDYADKFSVSIHAWVFMTNHVHLLCTPHDNDSISHMMQGLGRQYVRYFNDFHQRSGTLWEGRYKSCLVQEEDYLLQVYRYIELNPVRAHMVEQPEDYHWSSYQINALGKKSPLCSPHPLYLSLGQTATQRQETYQALFNQPINKQLTENIRQGIKSGMAIGDTLFKEHVEALTGCRMHPKKMGRPPATDD
ncbi:MAG: transposase [Gammaproteobacteria bacterium]|nr:transposase [Gammaproteobacteria bacterium]